LGFFGSGGGGEDVFLVEPSAFVDDFFDLAAGSIFEAFAVAPTFALSFALLDDVLGEPFFVDVFADGLAASGGDAVRFDLVGASRLG
jgi:hypothetical protein